MKVKEALDETFKDIKFDKDLLERLVRNNIQFTTNNSEVRDMMGGKLIGCYHLNYTHFHKSIFYEDVFGITYEEVRQGIKYITTVPKHFKIALDDINLVMFYMAHRFATAKDLTKDQRREGAIEAFNYFGYRTLVLICSDYWKYPMTHAKAVTLMESLSGNYLITKMKNWNEYVYYRSDEYIKSRLFGIVAPFTSDRELPNAINDLYNRYKDMIKNIYREFLNIDENDQLRSSKSVVADSEGQMVLMDRLTDARTYTDKVMNSFVSKEMFIRAPFVEVMNTPIIANITQEEIEECLDLVFEFQRASPKNNEIVQKFVSSFITDSIKYLKSKRLELNTNSNIVEVVSMITGNLLRSRGGDISITAVKTEGEALLKLAYKKRRPKVSDRNMTKIRNAFCVYILILALL